MERQYIGARYVPKFADPIEWNDQTSYEALTIVTYMGASYTSKKAVPAGIKPTDNSYWVVTGNYNAQVEEYRQEVIKVANDYSDIKEYVDKQNRKFLFLADSYDEYGGWVDKTASMLGLTSDRYWNIGKRNTSFASGSWLSLVQEWVASHPNDVKDIGTIVCGGGINDSDATGYSALPNALREFRSYINTTFGYDVSVKIAYFGWALNTSAILAGREANYRAAVCSLYARAESFGMEYLCGCEMVLHNRELLNNDGLHPNSEGGTRIAEVVSNAIKAGCASVVGTLKNATITPVNGTVSGVISQRVFEGQLFTNFDNLTFNNIGVTFSNNDWVKLADVKLPYGNGVWQFTQRVMCEVSSVNTTYDMMFYISGDALYGKINQITDGSWVTATAKIIHAINHNIVMCGIYD